ncbi:hypothetical protein H257_06918 [Aphanomyces astaci]|uniref:Profilin n=1 Tax=Aphanomyces astaci TaxID=112090 RepID=W4GIZ6_APHAT|nr:hypothetical protein H257_06918 [Aphanomyces astaci]ETV79665.1 hypothetical protein H257_06918 [Aphanomyces astaci]|eukprot:XP_009830601.1 hypothetical protein H257_06918 [Aphanomyces astaci]
MEGDMNPTVLAAMKAQKEWAKAVAFNQEGKVIAATAKPLDGEIAAFLKLFDSRDDTMGTGIVYLNEQYDVHRFHPPLIYGRRGDPAKGEGEGIAICKVEKASVYVLITYVLPTLSSRAVPQLQEFCAQQCTCMTTLFLSVSSLVCSRVALAVVHNPNASKPNKDTNEYCRERAERRTWALSSNV